MDEDVTTDDVCAVGKINLEHCGFFLQPNVTIPYNIRLYGDKNSEVSGELTFTSTLHWFKEWSSIFFYLNFNWTSSLNMKI